MQHRTLAVAGGLCGLAAIGSAQSFFDDFNRANGGLGSNYTTVSGSVSIDNNTVVGASGTGFTLVNASVSTAPYLLSTVQIDVGVRDQSSTLTYSAIAFAHNGVASINNGIYVKLQRQLAGGYSHIGIYTGNNSNSSAITTPGGNFQALAQRFDRARLTVRSPSSTTLYTGIDLNFDGIDEIVYNSTLNLGTLTLGNRVGLHNWGNTGNLDNFRVTVVPEPATLAVLSLGAMAALRRRKKA
jgi:hypothetical protein